MKNIPWAAAKKRHKGAANAATEYKKARQTSHEETNLMDGSVVENSGPAPDGVAHGDVVKIDGSFGEGGGQVLRNACAYAAILRKSVKIVNVRSGRPKPGLQRQHLVGLQLLEECCNGGAKLVGGIVGSEEIQFLVTNQGQTFRPDGGGGKRARLEESDRDVSREGANTDNRVNRKCVYTGDTRTAGSICLLLQAVLPFGLFSPRAANETDEMCFILKGGTNATMAPQFDYFEHVFLPTLKRCCRIDDEEIDALVLRRGFFPRGGGEVHVKLRPRLQLPLPAIRLTERGTIAEIKIRAFAGGACPRSVAKQLAESAKAYLLSSPIPGIIWDDICITCDILHYENAVGSGSGIVIVATTSSGCLLGGSAVGSPRTPLAETAQQAATEILDAINGGIGNACVDEYLGVSERSTGCLTLHTRTAIWLAEQMCAARFEVTRLGDGIAKADDETTGRIPGRHVIRCSGISFCS